MKLQARFTSGIMRGASDSGVGGVCGEGNSRFSGERVDSMDAMNSSMIFDKALSSESASWEGVLEA